MVALSILLLLPSAAGAQQLPSDPEANSPSGVVYELPFDRGRDDAAPRPRDRQEPGRDRGSAPADGDSGGSGAADDREPTSIRSENNFGSSSVVPGVDGGESGEDEAKQPADSGGGAGASSGGGGATPAGGEAAAIEAASSSSGPSDSAAWPLIALILIVGTAVGLLSGRAWRRRSGT